MFDLSVIHIAEVCVIVAILLLMFYIFYRLNLFSKE